MNRDPLLLSVQRNVGPTTRGDHRVLLIGASGFIGSAIARDLAAAGHPTTHLIRGSRPPSRLQASVRGDLTDLPSLVRACSRHDIVINAASFVGPNPRRQFEVNELGATNLATASELTGVSKLVYVSSTSVYGGRVPNGAREQYSGVVPRSTLSTSRLRAEQATLGAGGVVLRPHLVYGPGDRFFLGPLINAMQALGGWIEEGKARISTISSESLARVTIDVATASASADQGRIFHAAHPQTTTVSQLVNRAMSPSGLVAPDRSFSVEHALKVLTASGATESQLRMIAVDNWVDSGLIWQKVKCAPGPTIQISPASAAWYRRFLVSDSSETT
ncbi:NAD-dependent epimerase/dehydratase family protein [Cryobacterium sp. W22_MBD10_FK3]|uniref:NAD-dependent epimerase/dehydratase family protein n=1 Tax=Cryobacterium sp. W22_MBD10_FK3 TaxID=3240273 RepID=UPI003F8DB882